MTLHPSGLSARLVLLALVSAIGVLFLVSPPLSAQIGVPLPDAACDAVRDARAKIDPPAGGQRKLTEAETVAVLTEAAQRLQYGLLEKWTGHVCNAPAFKKTISCDYLVRHRGEVSMPCTADTCAGWDVLSDFKAECGDSKGIDWSQRRYLAVTPPAPPPPSCPVCPTCPTCPPPPPCPVCPPDQSAEIERLTAALAARDRQIAGATCRKSRFFGIALPCAGVDFPAP